MIRAEQEMEWGSIELIPCIAERSAFCFVMLKIILRAGSLLDILTSPRHAQVENSSLSAPTKLSTYYTIDERDHHESVNYFLLVECRLHPSKQSCMATTKKTAHPQVRSTWVYWKRVLRTRRGIETGWSLPPLAEPSM
jgi:hypothetical protein